MVISAVLDQCQHTTSTMQFAALDQCQHTLDQCQYTTSTMQYNRSRSWADSARRASHEAGSTPVWQLWLDALQHSRPRCARAGEAALNAALRQQACHPDGPSAWWRSASRPSGGLAPPSLPPP
eukprot:366147-Chlamydomonas_euryale.AAC.18